MNEEILVNIWNTLSNQGATESDFNTWKSNFEGDESIQQNVHTYLSDAGMTNSNYETWRGNVGLGKENAQQEDATVEQDATASTSENISSDSLQPQSEEAQEIINSYQDGELLKEDIASGKITNQEVINFVNAAQKEAELAPIEEFNPDNFDFSEIQTSANIEMPSSSISLPQDFNRSIDFSNLELSEEDKQRIKLEEEVKQKNIDQTAKADWEAYGKSVFAEYENIGSREVGPGTTPPREVQPMVDGTEGETNLFGQAKFWKNSQNQRRQDAINYGISTEGAKELALINPEDLEASIDEISGDYLNLGIDKEIQLINKRLKTETDPEKIKDLEEQKKSFFEDQGYVPLFNEPNNPESGIKGFVAPEINNAATEKASEEDPVTLESQRKKLYGELLYLMKTADQFDNPGRKITEGDDMAMTQYGGSAFTVKAGRSAFEEIGGRTRDLLGADDTYYDDMEIIAKGVDANRLPLNLNLLPGKSVVANKFNEKLKQYKVLNRAIEVQANLAKLPQENLVLEKLDKLSKSFTGSTAGLSENNDEVVQVFTDMMEQDFGMKIDEDQLNREGEFAGRWLVEGGLNIATDIAPLAAEIAIMKKIPLSVVSKYDKYTKNGVKMLQNQKNKLYTLGDAMNKQKTAMSTFLKFGSKSKAYNRGVDLLVGGVDEVAKLYLADQVGEGLWNQPGFVHNKQTGDVNFAFPFSLGVGNVGGSMLVKAMKQTYMPVLTPVLSTLGKSRTLSTMGQSLTQAGVGTNTLIFAEAMDKRYNELIDNKEYLAALEHQEKDFWHHYAENFLGMWMLSGKNTLTGLGKGMNADFLRSGLVPKRLPGTKAAEKKLGLKYGAEPEAIDAAKKTKLEALEKDKANMGKEAYEKEASKIRKAANDLQYLHEYNAATKTAKSKDGYYKMLGKLSVLGSKPVQQWTAKEKLQFAELQKHEMDYLFAEQGIRQGTKFANDMQATQKYYRDLVDIVGPTGLRLTGKEKLEYLDKFDASTQNNIDIGRLKAEIKEKPAKKAINEPKIKELETKNEKLNEEMKNINEGYEKVFDKMLEREIEVTRALAAEAGLGGNKFQVMTAEGFVEVMRGKGFKGDLKNTLGTYDRKTDTIFLNKEAIKERRDLGTPLHELTHAILRRSLKFKNNKLTKEGKQVIDKFLEGLDPKDRAIVERKIDTNYKFETFESEKAMLEAMSSGMFGRADSKGLPIQVKDIQQFPDGRMIVEKKPEYFAEEYLTAWSDAVKNREITYNSKLGDRLSDAFYPLLNKFYGKKFQANDINGENIFMMLQALQRAGKTGKLRGDIATFSKEAREGTAEGIAPSIDKWFNPKDAKSINKDQATKAEGDFVKRREIKEAIEKFNPTAKELANKIKETKDPKEVTRLEKELKNVVDEIAKSDPIYTRAEQRIMEVMRETGIIDKNVEKFRQTLFQPLGENLWKSLGDTKKLAEQNFVETLRNEMNMMVLNEYKSSQPLEKFIVNRGYLRSRGFLERQGVPQENIPGEAPRKKYGSLYELAFSEGKSILAEQIGNINKVRGEKANEIFERIKEQAAKDFTKGELPGTYKEIKPNELTEIVDMFANGMRVVDSKGKEIIADRAMSERISKAIRNNADLNKKEMAVLQRVFDRYHETFWTALPQGFTSTGKATMNRPKKLYEAYYNEVGKRATQETFGISADPSGRNPYVKLPSITPTNFKKPLGIVVDPVTKEVTYLEPNLKEHGGLMKLMLGEYARAFQNQATRSILDPMSVLSKNLSDGRSPLMANISSEKTGKTALDFMLNKEASSWDIYNLAERMMATVHANPQAYGRITRTADPEMVDIIEQVMILSNPNLAFGGLGYQKSLLLQKEGFVLPESISKNLSKGGMWKGFVLDAKRFPTETKKYVEEQMNVMSEIHPLVTINPKAAKILYSAAGIKDGRRNTLRKKSYQTELDIAFEKSSNMRKKQREKLEKEYRDELGVTKEDLLNISKNAAPMANEGVVKNILKEIYSEPTLEKQKQKLEEIKERDGGLNDINKANHDLLKIRIHHLTKAYKSKKLSAENMFMDGKMATSIIEGIRSLSSFEYMYLREGIMMGKEAPSKTKTVKGEKVNIENTPEYKKKYQEYIDSWKKTADWEVSFNEKLKEFDGDVKAAELATIRDAVTFKNEHLLSNSITAAEITKYVLSEGKIGNINNIVSNHKTFWATKRVNSEKVIDAKIEKEGKMVDNKVSFEGDMRLTKFASEAFNEAGGKTVVHVSGKNAAKHIAELNKLKEVYNEIYEPKLPENSLMFSKDRAQQKKNREIYDKAIKQGRLSKKKSRGMSAFDFDETLIIDGKNFVTATKGGKTVKISSGKWPIEGPKLAAEGYKFDFADFVNVRGGKDGPLLKKFKNRLDKFGPENMYILTARPAESATAIHGWLKSKGLEIPLENITGLGNSKGEAKAMWMLEKFSEGYNDMYFVDDALPNVKAVRDVLRQLDIKSDVQQALMFSKQNRGKEIHNILEYSTGVKAEKQFSKAEAEIRGKNVKRRTFFMPDSAADFELLIEPMLGKGKKGLENRKWFEENLIMPFERGINNLNKATQKTQNEYMDLRKKMKDTAKSLPKEVPGTNFTNDMAIRTYLWNKKGYEIPGLSESAKKKLIKHVENNASLKGFAEKYNEIVGDKIKEPSAEWWAETIATEVQNMSRGKRRQDYLAEWIESKNEIFSEANLNKMESVLGTNWRRTIEDMLYRMETGQTKPANLGKLGNAVMTYLNGSVGAIMNLNSRSATLQLISTVNFINHSFNNPIKAAAALANIKQYSKDFMMIMNSDMLVQRRNGLRINVTEAEIAAAAEGGLTPKKVIAKILQAGYLPTKVADSMAISMGGATFYRNRVKDLMKRKGMSLAEAEKQAFLDFQTVAERTQQSSRADLLSQQQVSFAGRLILPFANTPLQMNRIVKKRLQDIAKGRYEGVFGENSITEKASSAAYFMAIQSAIFAGLQSGLFAILDSDDEEKVKEKKVYALNTMADSFLRGMGIQGAVVAGLKNAFMKMFDEGEKGWKADYGEVAEELLNISPTIGSKFRKMDSAGNTYKFAKESGVGKEMGFDIDNPYVSSATTATEALTNIPVNRALRKINNLRNATDSRYSALERVMQFLGWSNWDLATGVDEKVINEGKDNEYTKYIGVQDLAVEDAKAVIKERKKEETKKKKKAKKAEQQEINKIEEKKNLEKQKEEGEEATCAAITSSGKRCKRKPVKGGYCTVHEKVEAREDGQEKQCAKVKSNGERCKMKTTNKSGLCYYHD